MRSLEILTVLILTGAAAGVACDESPANIGMATVAPTQADQTQALPRAQDYEVTVAAGGAPLLANGWAAEAGYADGPASEARFDRITDIASDKDGNVVIVDSGNGRIRCLTSDGRVETVAGSGVWRARRTDRRSRQNSEYPWASPLPMTGQSM